VPWLSGFFYILILVPMSARRHARDSGLEGLPPMLLLQYFVVILIGFGGLWSATSHLFMADWLAGQIGWPAGSPFQTELAFATLGLAIAALLAVWVTDPLITAVIIAKSVFLMGAAVRSAGTPLSSPAAWRYSPSRPSNPTAAWSAPRRNDVHLLRRHLAAPSTAACSPRS
jgi:hypothetical protein